MAIYHCSVKIISRSSGRSSIGAAAYRAGEKLTNDYDGITHDYTKKSGIPYNEIMLPENAPEEYKGRQTLWNAVEKAEKRKDAQTAREIEVALPTEFDRDTQIDIIKGYIQDNFVSRGMCADFAIHDKKDGNPHAHIMLTTRTVTPDGFGNKERDWNDKDLLNDWREKWAASCNREFKRNGIKERIDHRTLQEQGINREPTIHQGTAATQMEKRGVPSERGQYNNEVKERNYSYEKGEKELQQMIDTPAAHGAAALVRTDRELPAEQPRMELTAEQTARRLQSLQAEYINLEQKIQAGIDDNAKNTNMLRHIESRAEQMNERGDSIELIDGRLAKLREVREQLGVFKGKQRKEIDEQIQKLSHSREQAVQSFCRDYGIEPEQAKREIKQLNEKAQEIRGIQQRNMQVLQQGREKLVELAVNYKTEKALADIRPDNKSIEEMMNRKKEGIKERSAINRLNQISMEEYKKIIQRVEPDKAEKILKKVENRDTQFKGRGR